MITIVRILAVVGGLGLSSGAVLASATAASETTPTQTNEWQNPESIADIEDENERIRAFSVLIGQSVYDEMVEADAEEPFEITGVNIVDVTEALTPKDVLALELAAEMNEDSIRPLQSYLELREETKAKLEQEDVMPADVVGVQRSGDGLLHILVIPGWLTN